LAAAIAFRTCVGALAGGMAVPSDWIRAVPLGASGVVDVVTLPGEPVPPVWAIAGTAATSEATNSSPANASFLLLL
jgi:hypothetical protein